MDQRKEILKQRIRKLSTKNDQLHPTKEELQRRKRIAQAKKGFDNIMRL
jgi:hypothetical protein